MKLSFLLLVLLLALLAGFGGAKLATRGDHPEQAAAAETPYDRIMRTGTLRCGYFVWPPLVSKDTGQLKGLSYDMTMALAAALGWKVEWTQELAFSSYLQDIAAGRFDAECSGGWPNATRGKLAFFSKPYGYVPLVAIVRAGDTRFDGNPDTLNDAQVRIAVTDGETSAEVYHARLPLATQVSLPQTVQPTEMILNVTTGKADVTLLDSITAANFDKSNPGQIKIVNYAPPLHVIALSFTLPRDPSLQNAMDMATGVLLNNGTVENLLQKYEPYPGAFLRVTPPFSASHRP